MPAVETLEIFAEISQTGTWMSFYELQEDGLYEYCVPNAQQSKMHLRGRVGRGQTIQRLALPQCLENDGSECLNRNIFFIRDVLCAPTEALLWRHSKQVSSC